MRTLLHRSFVAALILLVAVPAGATTVIDFEDLNAGGPGATVTAVTNQYASLGVIFSNAMAFDYSKGPFAIPNFAHSGTKAVEACFASEFCSAPLSISFTAGQTRVKVWVGLSSSLSQTQTVYMHAFNSNNVEVATTTAVLPASSTPIPIRTPMQVGRFASDIARVDITFNPSGSGNFFNNSLSVDDVEFDTIGPPPPCPATQPPTVDIASPITTITTRCNRFLFKDVITTGDPFARRTLTAIGPQGQTQSWVTPVSSGTYGPIWMYGFLFPGQNTLVDQVEDCKGMAVSKAFVNYDPIPAGTGFTVQAMEVTQSIQTLYNFVPLISGKRTFVRVYLQLTGPLTSLDNISGTLNAWTPGSPPGFALGSPVSPLNVASLNSITVNSTTDLNAERKLYNATLNFVMPPEWTNQPMLHLELSNLTVGGCDTYFPCDGCSYPDYTGQGFPYGYVKFQQAPPLRVRLVSAPYTVNGQTFSPTNGDFTGLTSWLERTYPTADVETTQTALSARNGTPGSDFSCDDINSALNDMRNMETSSGAVDHRVHYYAIVSEAKGFMRGCAAGIPAHVASGPADVPSYGGHELGHTWGRYHAEFCGAQGGKPYPFLGGLINGYPYDYCGFDVGDPGNGIAPAVRPGDQWYDVMTYCPNEWLSSFTYLGILDQMNAEEPGGARRTPSADALMVSATINLTANTASLRPFWHLPGLDLTDRPAASDWAIVLKDASGTVLASYPFGPKLDTEHVAGEDLTGLMSEVVPWVTGTKRISITHSGTEIAFRVVTPNAPVVQVTAPNGGENLTSPTTNVTWQGSDADGDTLTYALQYSKDGGQTWQVVDTGLTGSPYTVDLSLLPGSTQALFKVIATDGVNTGSDVSNAVFQVYDKAPTVRIVSPGDGAAYTSDDTVSLFGEGNDLQDGKLTGASLTWTSNIQGTLGTGPSLSVVLLPGTHTITLTGKDSKGLTGSATISVQVTAAPPMPRPIAPPYTVVGVPVTMDGSASMGVPSLTFHWDIVSAPDGSTAALSNADTAKPTLTPDKVGSYVLQLTLKDGTGASAVARVTINATNAVNVLRIAGGLAAASSADMVSANVDNGGTSANRIDIVDAVRLARHAFADQTGSGVVTVSAANQIGSIVVGQGYGIVIDDPRLNGAPEQRVLATHQYVGAFGHTLAVQYSTTYGKWTVFNEDHSVMPIGEKINYTFGPNINAVTRGSAGGPFAWGVYLDAPSLSFNPNAVPLAIHNYVASPGDPLGIWYNGSRWVAYSENGTALPNTERYFWTDAASSGGRVLRSSTNSYLTYGVYLQDSRIDHKPDAIVLAQHDTQGGFNTSAIGVWYDGAHWIAYNEDKSPMANGEAINYLIAAP